MDNRELFRPFSKADEFDRIVYYNSIPDMWAHCVAEYGDRVAIEDNGKKYTFSQLEKDAGDFRAVVGETGKRVALLSANSYELVRAFIAVVTSGNTAIVLPPQLDANTVYGVCMKLSADMLVYSPELSENTATFKALSGKRLIDITDTSGQSIQASSSDGQDPAVIMFTGGTTGKSKGALLSHRAVMNGTVNGCYGISGAFYQRYLLVLPLSHVFGLIRNLMTSLYTGSTLFICRSNKDMFRDAAVFKPTVMVLVPALAEMALSLSRRFGKNMLGPDLKYIICGAAAVSPYLIKEYPKMGITLLAGYGLTESANLVAGNPISLQKPESVGIPYPNQELRVVDGELWLKGDNMMDGYVGDDEENRAAYTDGWFRTGDLVRFDEDGYLYIVGRTKEIIVLSNGENVSPAEVEAHFNTPEFIQASQVFEDVTENGTHYLSLEVVPRISQLADVSDPVGYITKELERINQTLPPYQRVNKIVVRDSDFERTPSMKIKRYKKC